MSFKAKSQSTRGKQLYDYTKGQQDSSSSIISSIVEKLKQSGSVQFLENE